VSDTVVLAILGIVAMVVKDWLDRRRSTAQDTKLNSVASDVRKVELATNSMKDALVEKAGKAGEQKGADDERARQSAREGGP
jgi:hypothetical protein